MLKLSEAGLKDMRGTVARVREAVSECNIPTDELHMGGPPIDNEAIDLAGEQRLMVLFGVSIAIGICVSWYSLRSFWLVLLVVFTGVYSMFLSLAIIYYTGQGVNAIVLTMPTLVYVATTSGAIHLANYYRDSIREGTPIERAPGHAIRHALLPLSLATGTTAVGLMTLCVSGLVPIKMFGIYSAIGVVLSFLLCSFSCRRRCRPGPAGSPSIRRGPTKRAPESSNGPKPPAGGRWVSSSPAGTPLWPPPACW